MKILVMTNTYRPFTGGVPRSIDAFAGEYRKLGHTVKIVAPDFEGQREDPDAIRVPALQRFNGTDFSVRLPIPFYLTEFVDSFQPDIIHSQHPFLLGNAALRIAARLEKPIVYTFHTFYERYLHYLPGGDSAAMRRFVSVLVAGYSNLCDQVIAPSRSVADELARRGVEKPVEVIPTGVQVKAIAAGDGKRARARLSVPRKAFVIGFVSRLAAEKNLAFLCEAVLRHLEKNPNAWFLIAGTGPLKDDLKARFAASGARDRIRLLGNLEGGRLAGLYKAMDVFAFASHSETQGMVLTEAMAAGTPVVALRASGVEDVVEDKRNGRLLEAEDAAAFARALKWVADRDPAEAAALRRAARQTAAAFSARNSARKALRLYGSVQRAYRTAHRHESALEEFLHVVSTEWNLFANLGKAAGDALLEAVAGEENEENAENDSETRRSA